MARSRSGRCPNARDTLSRAMSGIGRHQHDMSSVVDETGDRLEIA
jgi:hypothetical protein